jgi:Flp pilus assembly protein TadG
MPTLIRMIRRLKEDPGQALIEFILVLPIIFLLIVNTVNFGGFFYAWITVANAARAGANYAILGSSSVSGPGASLTAPTVADITTVIQHDMQGLPNLASLSINVCQNKNGTVTTLAGTCTSVPADPEASVYTLTTVDVTYTYAPFIPVFSFPNLGIYLTIPPTTVYQRAEMRQIL